MLPALWAPALLACCKCRFSSQLPPNCTLAWSLVLDGGSESAPGVDMAPTLLDPRASDPTVAYIGAGSLAPSTAYVLRAVVNARWPGGEVLADTVIGIVTAGCPFGGVVVSSTATGVAGATR